MSPSSPPPIHKMRMQCYGQDLDCGQKDMKRLKNHRSNCQHPLDHWKSERVLLYWLCQSLWLRGSQQTVENSLRDENTRPPYLPPEKSVCRSRARHGTTDKFQIEKGVCQGCILSPCLFNSGAEYIMRNAGLEEAQTDESRWPGEISITSDMQMIPHLWQKVKN